MIPQPASPQTIIKPVVPAPPNHPKLLWILLVLFLLLAVGAGGVFLGKQMATPAATPFPTPDPTADWKSYEDSDLKISFRYPDLFKPEEANLRYDGDKNKKGLTLVYGKNSDIFMTINELTLSQTELTKRLAIKPREKIVYENGDVLERVESVAVGNINAVRLLVTPGSNFTSPVPYYWVYVNTNQREYEIVYFADRPDYDGNVIVERPLNNQEILIQILSTFKFTNALSCEKGQKAYIGNGHSLCYPTVDTDFKTYVSKKFPITINYPTSLEVDENEEAVYFHCSNDNKPETISSFCQLRISTTEFSIDESIERGPKPIYPPVNLTVSGLPAIQIETQGEERNNTTYVKKGNVTYEITYLANYPQVQDVMNKMISTFKFTDESFEGKTCGGIANLPCPSGYSCNIPAMYPDATGSCTKN